MIAVSPHFVKSAAPCAVPDREATQGVLYTKAHVAKFDKIC